VFAPAMSKKKKDQEVSTGMSVLNRLLWLALAGAWVLVFASLISYTPHDPPGHSVAPLNEVPQNWCGAVGAFVAYKAYLMFGIGVWVIMTAVATLLGAWCTGRTVDQLSLRAVGVILMGLSVSGLTALLLPTIGPLPEGAGGLIAIAGIEQLADRFSTFGSALVLLMMFAVGSILAADEIVLALPAAGLALLGKLTEVNWPNPVAIGRSMGESMIKPFQSIPEAFKRPETERGESGRRIPVRNGKRVVEDPDAEDVDSAEGPDGKIDADAGGLGGTESFHIKQKYDTETAAKAKAEQEARAKDADDRDDKKAAKKSSSKNKSDDTDAEADDDSAKNAVEVHQAAEDDKDKKLDPEAIREKMRNMPISIASAKKPKTPAVAPVQDLSGYKFPPMDILAEPETNFSEQMADYVREQAEILEHSLQTYKIDGEVVAIDAGPVITLFEVQLAPGTKVSQLNTISSDLARELKAQNIRIVPNTAGKSTVGVEVPNLKKEKVALKELMALASDDATKMNLPMYLGKDASGEPLVADLAAMPHMLIAGTTGSGKSVCMNSIVMSFLYTRKPDEIKLVLVDPKMVEMAQFRDIPHLMCPVVTEMNKAAAILEWAVTKMEERYALLAEAGVRDINSYNDLGWEGLKERFEPDGEEEEAKIPKKLPRLVFIIDELADLMMTNKEVEGFIVRIAQKARAVGIHLILATQRPQANVVTGLIKSNMPCRVCMKVSSGMDSRIVLDQKGGELLLGHGDMLFLSPRSAKLTRAQGTFVTDSEIRQAVKFLKKVADQVFEPQLVQLKAPGNLGDDEVERDPLFDDAVRIVLETRRGSVSLLQRRLAIGYSRSSRLIEEMAQAGIIGEYKGSQAREVNFTLEEWDAIKAAAEAEAAGIDLDEATTETAANGDVDTEEADADDANADAEASTDTAGEVEEAADDDVEEEDDAEPEAEATLDDDEENEVEEDDYDDEASDEDEEDDDFEDEEDEDEEDEDDEEEDDEEYEEDEDEDDMEEYEADGYEGEEDEDDEDGEYEEYEDDDDDEDEDDAEDDDR